jgi:L,D-transpeptidase ErfK/SrfK
MRDAARGGIQRRQRPPFDSARLLLAVRAASRGLLWLAWASAALGETFAQPGSLDGSPPRVVGGAFAYAAQPGDSLTSVGARFGVDVATLARANGLPADARLALAQTLRVANPHLVPPLTAKDAIVLNIPQRMLFQARAGELLGAYPIAAGRPSWRTPRGQFEIDGREIDKTWIVPRSIQEEMAREGKPVRTQVPPGPENPLGRHWLGLSRTSCGIHGTIAPTSIFSLRTHGCVRLHPNDIAEVFERAALGDSVRIVYEPLLLAALPGGRVCLESHRDAYGLAPPSEETLTRQIEESEVGEIIDLSEAQRAAAACAGIAVDVTRGARGEPCV